MRNEEAFRKRVIWLYYAFQFSFSLLVWLPIFYEYQKRIGLSEAQIFSIQSAYYLLFCILEIPTGLLADTLGYRLCLRMGATFLVLANLLPIFAQNYSGFMMHFALIALSRSLISGASSAYLYQFLGQTGAPGAYKEIEGKARAYSLVGKVVCWSAVGVLMGWHLTLPYWFTVFFAIASLAFAFILPKETAAPQTRSAALGWTQTWSAVRSVGANSLLIFLILQGVAIFVLGRICQVNLFQPILSGKSVGLESYGLVMSLMTLFEALGSAFPGKVRRLWDDLSAVFVLTLIMAVSLAAIPWIGASWTIVSLCIFSWACGVSFPIQRQLINDSITEDRFRATILSIESIVDRAVCAWVASLLGGTLARGGLDGFLIESALLTLSLMGILYLLIRFGLVSKPARSTEILHP